MMKLNKPMVTAKMLEEFSRNFILELNKLKESLNKFDMDLSKALPETFNGESIAVEAVYSHDKKHILLMFKRSETFNFHWLLCNGDVFNTLAPYGAWNNSPAAFSVRDSTNIDLKNFIIEGGKPFELYGNIDIIINELELNVPYRGLVKIDYAFVLSCEVFIQRFENLKQYVDDFARAHWEYYIQDKPKDEFQQSYEEIKFEMERLFFDETILEQEIDDFISENHMILEQCLGLIKPIRQGDLKNVHGDNPKDFRPDLIAYDQNNHVWKIVDYKRAKRKIIRNEGKARAHFKAEITELEAQLHDYIEYFEDKEQRDYFLKKYGVSIEYPEAVGIIGNVNHSEVKEFNRIKGRRPRWLEIIPYNYLYERYCRFLDTVYKVMNS